MPGNSYAPPVYLSGEADWRRYRGVTLYTVGATPVAASATVGVYEDHVQALCGYTSQSGRSLQEDAQAGWNASGAAASVITIGFDENDRIFVHSSAVAFTIQDQTGAHGLPTAPTAAVATAGGLAYGAGWVALGTSEWTRGAWRYGTGGHYLWITPAAALQYVAPSAQGQVTALPVLLRRAAIGDADSTLVGNCLEAWENTAVDAVTRRIRWSIDDDGHVVRTRPAAIGATVTWVDASFRAALGFTGRETETASGALRILRAELQLPAGIRPYGLRRCDPWLLENADVLELRSGALAVQELSVVRGWDVEVYVRGPAHGDDDETRHLRDRFLPLVRRGAGLNIYRHWGDTRRALPRASISSSQLAYTLLYTSERDGTRGRLRCVRDITDEATRRPAYEGKPEIRQLCSFVLRERVD